MSELLDELRSALPDRYRVERQVGQGGMATVFVCEDTRYERKVAIKVLNPDLGSALGTDRFAREIQVLGKLNHPHILPVLDSGEVNGLLYYVMPFVEGRSVRDKLAEDGHLPIEEALAITCDVADALGYAHGLGIIHRDIKPENILIHGGHAVVADFGIARLAQDTIGAEKLTVTGVSVGTVSYMAPEQAAGEKADARSDIYSLGCMLYELLAGEPPFTGPNAMAIMARHTMEMPRSIRVVRQSVPPEIEEAVLHALEKSPVDRFKSMEEFKQALLGQAGTVTAWRVSRGTPMRGTSPAEGRWPWTKTQLVGTLSAAGFVLLLLVAGAWKLLSRSGQSVMQAGSVDAIDPSQLAVTYFKVDGANPELSSVADGLTESLIDKLGSVRALHVSSRNAVAALRSAAPDSIAKALGVGTIVTGEVGRSGDRLHVEVQLFDAAANARINHKGFDVPMADVALLRDSLATQVAEFLRAQLKTQIDFVARRKETSNGQAWLALQRGERRRKDADSLFAAGQIDPGLKALDEADAFLRQAATLDRQWAEPHAMRAMAATQRARVLVRARPADAPTVIDSGLVDAEHALALDPRSADALEARGTLRYYRFTQLIATNDVEARRNLDASEKDLIGATTVNPAQASAFATLSSLYYRKQALSDAVIAARSAYQADAYLASMSRILERLFWTLHDTESFADAETWCREGQRRFPANPFFVECGLWLLSTKYKQPYDPDAAWRVYETLKKATPPARLALDTLRGRIVVGMVLARAADAAKADNAARAQALIDSASRVLSNARPSSEVDPKHELYGFEAAARVALHQYDEAVSLLKTYIQSNPEHARGFKTNTAWWWRDPKMQDHAGFKAMLAGIR